MLPASRFIVSLVQGHSISIAVFVNRTCWFWIKAMDVRNVFVFFMMVLAFTFNMMVLNFVLCFDFLHRSNCWSVHFSAIFAGAALLQVYYILNLSASIVGASAAIMGILVAVTTYQPLMNVRLLLIGNIKYGILQL
jgi:hypothetical protein